jgi:hypothetical protein
MDRKSASLLLFVLIEALSTMLSVPHLVHASVRITEIMYDVPGANVKKQWIEIQNIGDAPVDFHTKTARLIDAHGKHVLTVAQGNSLLVPGGISIVAQDPALFLEKYPMYGGSLLKSSFTLSSAATLSVAGTDDVSSIASASSPSVSYSSELGAKGDGNSLQYRDAEHDYVAGTPTPGLVPLVPPPAIITPAKPLPVQKGSTKQATSNAASSHKKRSVKNSSPSAYDQGSLAPAASAEAEAAGAVFAIPALIQPYTFLFSSPWFAGFIGLIVFSAFAILVIQRHYKP